MQNVKEELHQTVATIKLSMFKGFLSYWSKRANVLIASINYFEFFE